MNEVQENNLSYYVSKFINGTNQSHVATQEGDYFVIVTGDNQCVSAASNIITVTFTGINDLTDLYIKIYPNPVKEKLYIENKYGRDLQVEIYDLTGMLVKNSILKGENIEIDVKSLKPSMYLLKITMQGETRIVKIIKN